MNTTQSGEAVTPHTQFINDHEQIHAQQQHNAINTLGRWEENVLAMTNKKSRIYLLMQVCVAQQRQIEMPARIVARIAPNDYLDYGFTQLRG